MHQYGYSTFDAGKNPKNWRIDDKLVLIGKTGNLNHYGNVQQIGVGFKNEYCGAYVVGLLIGGCI
jgi:hypothetical protein